MQGTKFGGKLRNSAQAIESKRIRWSQLKIRGRDQRRDRWLRLKTAQLGKIGFNSCAPPESKSIKGILVQAFVQAFVVPPESAPPKVEISASRAIFSISLVKDQAQWLAGFKEDYQDCIIARNKSELAFLGEISSWP